MTLRKLFRIALGLAMIAVGIMGLILPIMPGWVFIIPGLLILADYFPPIRRLVNWAKRKLTGEKPAPKTSDDQRSRPGR